MNSFLGFGREHVVWNFEKSENPVYLHIMQRRKPEPDETGRQLKKPTLLAIALTCSVICIALAVGFVGSFPADCTFCEYLRFSHVQRKTL
ncbi:hypothetical protein ZWY2020_046824 [Hordeum vulgare]|nr:hypothetical protein ZWY2020_046824 [Hordeum vulgare]